MSGSPTSWLGWFTDRHQTCMARNLRRVHDLTPTRVRESTVVADFADFADVDMHAPPAFIMLSRKRNQEFLFQGVDLEVTFFGIFLSIWPSTSNLIFCLFAETLSQTLTWRHTGTPTLSLSLSHSLPLPSQIRAVSTFLLVSFVSKRVRNREALSNPSTNYSVIESTTSSAH